MHWWLKAAIGLVAVSVPSERHTMGQLAIA
jgi:hypothetical protein